MNIKLFLASVMVSLSLISVNANAAFIDVTPSTQVSSGTLNLVGAQVGIKPNLLTIGFSGTSKVGKILFSRNAAAHLPNQSPEAIGEAIEDLFSVDEVNLVNSGDISGSSSTISSIDPFSFLAVHFGKHELLFQFLKPMNSFTIDILGGKAAGLSNFRAYQPSVVPVPAAVWLFGSALLGLTGIKRKSVLPRAHA